MKHISKDEFRKILNEGYPQYPISSVSNSEVMYGSIRTGELTEDEKTNIEQLFAKHSVVDIARILGRPRQMIFSYTFRIGLCKKRVKEVGHE